jgi:LmbE family N-acetylglucosaminyl deacetylase
MFLSRKSAEVYALHDVKATHLAIAAHPDDIEIMALDGILHCFQKDDAWFAGVVATDGAGSARTGIYADYSDKQMRAVRKEEQKKAALIGEYSAVFFLDYPSSAVKDASRLDVASDIAAVVKELHPDIIYTHSLADKHPTHVSVVLRALQALRSLPEDCKPKKVYGCEAWRDLDWMSDSEKITFALDGHEGLAAALVGVFDSQIAGGKRYDLATEGRRRANATYLQSHSVDQAKQMSFAMDLSPLLNPELSIEEFIINHIRRFEEEVRNQIIALS